MIDSSLTATSAGLRAPWESAAGNASTPEAQLRCFARFLGRVFIFLSMFCFALSAYLGFVHYWILTHSTKASGTVVSGEIQQRSSGSTARPGSAAVSSSEAYFFHCVVSYRANGEVLQAELDSPPSSYRIDAQAWAGQMAPGRTVDILYVSSNPSRIRLANNPAEVTVMGSIKAAFYFLVPGLLLVFTSRPKSDP